MHSSRLDPDGAVPAHRAHPPSKQFFTPRGVPLYPVEMIRFSDTTTAATLRREQLARVAVTCAISMK
jgi:hypothetical protein